VQISKGGGGARLPRSRLNKPRSAAHLENLVKVDQQHDHNVSWPIIPLVAH
jgi:hypothetical protein